MKWGLACIVLLVIIVIPLGARAQVDPEFTWTFEEPTEHANVHPNGSTSGVAEFSGNLQVDTNSASEVQVNLRIQAGGWGAAISPSSLTVPQPATTSNFTIRIVVLAPLMTPPETRTITAEGDWQSGEGRVGDVPHQYLDVEVDEYQSFYTVVRAGVIDLEKDKKGTINVHIKNWGNVADTFTATVGEAVDHIKVDIGAPVTINANESGILKVGVKPSKDGFTGSLRLNITSKNSLDTNITLMRGLSVSLKVKKSSPLDVSGFEAPMIAVAISIFAIRTRMKRRRQS